MQFVATKTPEQRSCLMLHRTRDLFIHQQTAVINAIRAHLAELGIIAPVVAFGVGMDQSTLSKVERAGPPATSLATLARIADYLDFTVQISFRPKPSAD